MEHLNGIFARVGGNLNNNFQKGQMPGGLPGGGGMLKLRSDRYIMCSHYHGILRLQTSERLLKVALSYCVSMIITSCNVGWRQYLSPPGGGDTAT